MDRGGPTPEDILLEELGSFALKPRSFVYWGWAWREEGTELAKRSGPELWQDELLTYLEAKLLAGLLQPDMVISEAIQIAVKSGHNIGKSALVCWLIIWALSTREDTKGVVTANTEKQLRLKLWAELAKWHRLFIAKQFFRVTATSIQASDPDREKEWRIDAIPWSEDNPEAFAGLHNLGKRIIVIFDEASGVVDKIWETIDGVMNESGTELIWIATGNPTRNIGRFRDCFTPEGQGQFWHTFSVDSRSVSFTNKERIQKAIDLWGEDNDYIKVRWLGQFPSSSAAQLISSDLLQLAMNRDAVPQQGDPLIMGVDVARYGDNESVITFRRGKDARSIPALRYRNLNNVELGNQIASLKRMHNPDAIFVDGGGVGGGVIDFLRHLGHNPIEVQFGSSASIPLGGEHAANKRAEMYLSMRTWLKEGGCIENSQDLYRQGVSIEYTHSKAKSMKEAIILTPKEEMDESPDWMDSLATTFAFPVSAIRNQRARQAEVDYDPLSLAAFNAGIPQEEVMH
jgi:hypothetical protein